MGNLILICHAVPSGAQLSGIKLTTFPGLDGSLCKWDIALNAGKGWCRPFKVYLAIAAGTERERDATISWIRNMYGAGIWVMAWAGEKGA